MNALPAAIVWAVMFLVVMNLYVVPTMKRRHIPTDPRRLAKYAIVSFRQATPQARINLGLFASILVMAIWMAL